MDEKAFQSRLSQISTVWGLLDQAHRSNDAAVLARRELVRRYQGAAYRYLRAAVRDTDLADDLFQEFALRVMQGRFQGADTSAGRFRDYLKTSLYRLVIDHYRKRKKLLPVVDPTVLPVALWDTNRELSEECFISVWRQELLASTWQALERYEHSQQKPYYSVLKFHTDYPQLTSSESAKRLSEQLQRDPPLSATAFRKMLQRARTQFAQLLLQEVTTSLGTPDQTEIEQELIDLNLHKYCRHLL